MQYSVGCEQITSKTENSYMYMYVNVPTEFEPMQILIELHVQGGMAHGNFMYCTCMNGRWHEWKEINKKHSQVETQKILGAPNRSKVFNFQVCASQLVATCKVIIFQFLLLGLRILFFEVFFSQYIKCHTSHSSSLWYNWSCALPQNFLQNSSISSQVLHFSSHTFKRRLKHINN